MATLTAGPRGELRMVVGYVLMPPTAALLTAAVFWDVLPASGTFVAGGQPTLGIAIAAAIVSVPVTVFGAIPAVAWLQSRGPLTLGRLAALGAVLGNLPFAISLAAIVAVQIARGVLPGDAADLWYGWAGAVRNIVVGSCCGSGCAGVFWFVSIHGTELDEQYSPPTVLTTRDRIDPR